jgi:hypothetical protein
MTADAGKQKKLAITSKELNFLENGHALQSLVGLTSKYSPSIPLNYLKQIIAQ